MQLLTARRPREVSPSLPVLSVTQRFFEETVSRPPYVLGAFSLVAILLRDADAPK